MIFIFKIDFYLLCPKMMIRLVMLLLQLSHHCPCVHILTCAWYFSLACSSATDKLVTSRSYGWPPGISDDYNEYYVCTDSNNYNYWNDYNDYEWKTTWHAPLLQQIFHYLRMEMVKIYDLLTLQKSEQFCQILCYKYTKRQQ